MIIVDIENSNIISRAQGSANFIFFLLFFIASNVMFAQQYDINDPRNPDCPCHKMQQLADKEFLMLGDQNNLNENDREQNVNNVDFEKNSNEGNGLVENKGASHNYGKIKRRQKNTWIKKKVFKISNKYRFKKRKKINVAICYKWVN
ncbi:MAG: hypothetical protein IPH89_13945 [Bacteroidetes bacterium]|nr:hypothetical protein [Bacteroidota bacterium]